MDTKTKLLITTQAAVCVEEILETIEKNSKATPWVTIVEQNMVRVVEQYERNKSGSTTAGA